MAIVHVGTTRLQVEPKGTRRALVEGLIAQIEESVRGLVARCIEEALEAEVTALLERGWYKRHRPRRRWRTEARCKACGSQDPQGFRRDGHYQRCLDTSWGRLRINVPQIGCIFEGWVRVPFKTLRSRQRFWDDLEGEIRERYGWGMSLRRIKESVDARLGSSVSLRTLNRCVREMAQLVLCSFIPPQASLLCSTNGSSVALPAAQTRSPVTGTILLSVLSLTQVVFPDGRIHYPCSVD